MSIESDDKELREEYKKLFRDLSREVKLEIKALKRLSLDSFELKLPDHWSVKCLESNLHTDTLEFTYSKNGKTFKIKEGYVSNDNAFERSERLATILTDLQDMSFYWSEIIMWGSKNGLKDYQLDFGISTGIFYSYPSVIFDNLKIGVWSIDVIIVYKDIFYRKTFQEKKDVKEYLDILFAEIKWKMDEFQRFLKNLELNLNAPESLL